MSNLILPHGSRELNPLLLVGRSLEEESKKRAKPKKGPNDQPGNERSHHDGDRSVHAAGWVYGQGRLARLL